jgi:hypothetical protein
VTTLPHSFIPGQAAYAQTFQEVFDAITQALDNGDGTRLIDNAGIRSYQLADRFSVHRGDPIVIIPPYVGEDWRAVAPSGRVTALPNALETVHWWKERVKAGQQVFLCDMEVSVIEATEDAGSWPVLDVLVDGNNIAGGDIIIDPTVGNDDSFFFRINDVADPIESPLVALNDGSLIEVRLAKDGGGEPTIRGLVITPVYKRELVR